jgi:hypothetical protein
MSTSDDLREGLAALAHNQWSGWMFYMFKQCTLNEDGTSTIPARAVKRWQRQMSTPYSQLPESERESDKQEADKVITVIEQYGR